MSKNELEITEAGNGFDAMDDEKVVSSDVPVKYRGTVDDKRDMMILGKKQVLRRNFKFLTMLGFASTVMVAWEIVPIISVFALEDGGTPIIFWGLIMASIGMSAVYASLAECASMYPTAGGQYHWVSELAPARFQKGLSYSVGWLLAIGWQVYLAGVCFMVGGVLDGLIALNNPDYVYQSWHTTLLSVSIIAFSIVFNTVLAVRLPLVEGLVLILHVAGLFAIIIPLWVMAPRGNAHATLLVFTDNGGWGNTGLSTMIGMTSITGLLIGYDCSVHMSEEVQDASRTIPKVIVWSVLPNALMCFIMGVTFIFCLGDLTEILASPTGQPFLQVFFNATQSYAGTNVMAAILVIMLTSACISEVATASRQIWSFARDGGLPGSEWLSKVSPGWNIPLRAVCVSLVVSSLLALINIGSSTALNAINSLGGVSILFSYTITIGCLIWRRLRGAPLPARRWSLGSFGLPVNIAALIFVLPILFFYVWPLATPVTAVNMNWSSPMFFAVLIIAAIYYFVKARHVYTGPVLLVHRDD